MNTDESWYSCWDTPWPSKVASWEILDGVGICVLKWKIIELVDLRHLQRRRLFIYVHFWLFPAEMINTLGLCNMLMEHVTWSIYRRFK